MIDAAGRLFLLIQIFFVDLLLGADNAVVIALACRRLPPEHTLRAILLGAIGAIADSDSSCFCSPTPCSACRW
jgi:predicted tellurium resistance membrane protein TerC